MVPVAESPAGAREMRFDAIVILLEAALHLLDEIGDRPAIGARLHSIIDDVRGELEN